MPEYPFSRNNVTLGRSGKKIPGVVLEKSSVFFLHGSSPVWIGKCTAESAQHWRQSHAVVEGREAKTIFSPGCHAMIVDNQRDGGNAFR
jgi:hypothetical protein